MAQLVDLDNLTTTMTSWIGKADGTGDAGTGKVRTTSDMQAANYYINGSTAYITYNSTTGAIEFNT